MMSELERLLLRSMSGNSLRDQALQVTKFIDVQSGPVKAAQVFSIRLANMGMAIMLGKEVKERLIPEASPMLSVEATNRDINDIKELR